MSGDAGNPPDSSAPYGKKGSKTTMYVIMAVLLVAGLLAGYFIGAVLSQPKDVGSQDRLRDVLDRGELIVASDTTWPPFEIYNSTSKIYEGVDIEIVQRIADEMGVKLTIKPFAFDAVIGAVQSGQADIAISSITITEERAQSVNFSDSYYLANQGIIVRAGSGIDSIDDLNGKKIGGQISTTGLSWAQDNLPNSTVSTYTEISPAVLDLSNRNIDAVICDTPVANKFADDPSYDLELGFTVVTNEYYGIVVAKGNPLLLNAINNVLTEIKADGSLQAIIAKWNAD